MTVFSGHAPFFFRFRRKGGRCQPKIRLSSPRIRRP